MTRPPSAIVKFAGGAVGKTSASFDVESPYAFNIDLLGDKGAIRDNHIYAQQFFAGQTDWITVPTIRPDSGDVTHHPFDGEIAHFLDCIQEDRELFVNLEDAAKTHAVCFALEQSAAEGRPVRRTRSPRKWRKGRRYADEHKAAHSVTSARMGRLIAIWCANCAIVVIGDDSMPGFQLRVDFAKVVGRDGVGRRSVGAGDVEADAAAFGVQQWTAHRVRLQHRVAIRDHAGERSLHPAHFAGQHFRQAVASQCVLWPRGHLYGDLHALRAASEFCSVTVSPGFFLTSMSIKASGS